MISFCGLQRLTAPNMFDRPWDLIALGIEMTPGSKIMQGQVLHVLEQAKPVNSVVPMQRGTTMVTK